jgi:L-serine/L-threonine ammonia-lyase
MSQATGHEVFLKMECYQPCGSFKIRGIGALCQEWIAAGKKQLVSSSGGNAGFATAYAGKKLGVAVTVFVPSSTNQIYLDHIRAEGATVNVVGKVWDEANEAAKKFAAEIDGGFVPPFDHPTIWAGNETLMDEVVTQMQKPDAIVVAVGGGGLACGILQGLHDHDWQDVPLFCVETSGAASLAASIKANKLVTLPTIDTIALTLGAKRVTEQLFNWTKKHKIVSLTVSDQQTVFACHRFIDDHRVLVEPACGAALAVVYDKMKELKNFKRVLVIVCGGIGMSLELLNQYLQKFSQ